jgi:hypothetical protein
MDFEVPEIPDDMLTVWLPESESGMDPNAEGSMEEMTLEHPEKEPVPCSRVSSSTKRRR